MFRRRARCREGADGARARPHSPAYKSRPLYIAFRSFHLDGAGRARFSTVGKEPEPFVRRTDCDCYEMYPVPRMSPTCRRSGQSQASRESVSRAGPRVLNKCPSHRRRRRGVVYCRLLPPPDERVPVPRIPEGRARRRPDECMRPMLWIYFAPRQNIKRRRTG